MSGESGKPTSSPRKQQGEAPPIFACVFSDHCLGTLKAYFAPGPSLIWGTWVLMLVDMRECAFGAQCGAAAGTRLPGHRHTDSAHGLAAVATTPSTTRLAANNTLLSVVSTCCKSHVGGSPWRAVAPNCESGTDRGT